MCYRHILLKRCSQLILFVRCVRRPFRIQISSEAFNKERPTTPATNGCVTGRRFEATTYRSAPETLCKIPNPRSQIPNPKLALRREVPNPKPQIPGKIQITNPETGKNVAAAFGFSPFCLFGIYLGFGAWDLGFLAAASPGFGFWFLGFLPRICARPSWLTSSVAHRFGRLTDRFELGDRLYAISETLSNRPAFPRETFRALISLHFSSFKISRREQP